MNNYQIVIQQLVCITLQLYL